MKGPGSSKSPSFEIARASARDCSACARLLVEQLTEHGVDVSAKSLTKVLTNVVDEPAHGFLLAARANGEAVGVANAATIPSAEHCGIIVWLEELYVMPKHRGRGIGRALIEAVVEQPENLVLSPLTWRSTKLTQAWPNFISGFQPLKRSRWVKRLAE